MTSASATTHPVRNFFTACATFATNVVDRFHEHADTRLAAELTMVEQRRRLLGVKQERPALMHRGELANRQAHVD